MNYKTQMIIGHLVVLVAYVAAAAIVGAVMFASGVITLDVAPTNEFSVACHTFDTVGHTLPTSCE